MKSSVETFIFAIIEYKYLSRVFVTDILRVLLIVSEVSEKCLFKSYEVSKKCIQSDSSVGTSGNFDIVCDACKNKHII